MSRPLTVALFLLAVGLCRGQDFTWQNYDAVKKEFALRPGDMNWEKVAWMDTVYDAVAEARRVDKPVLLWLYFGDPRGRC